MNLCRECGEDFGVVSTFDKHRAGKHAYTWAEGIQLGVEDGRRCLTVEEMTGKGWKQDKHGRWRTAGPKVRIER